MVVRVAIRILVVLAAILETATCLSITATTTSSSSMSYTPSRTESPSMTASWGTKSRSGSQSFTMSTSVSQSDSSSASASHTASLSETASLTLTATESETHTGSWTTSTSQSSSASTTGSNHFTGTTLSPTLSVGTATLSSSVRVSWSSKTPTTSIGSVSPTFSKRFTKSSRSLTHSLPSTSSTASLLVSRSTRSRSVSMLTHSRSASKHVSRSTKTPTTSESPSAASETQRPTESREPSPTTLLSVSLSMSACSRSSAVTATATRSLSSTGTSSATATLIPSSSATINATPTKVASSTHSVVSSPSLSGTPTGTGQYSSTRSAFNSTSGSVSTVGTRTASPVATVSHGLSPSASIVATPSSTRDLPPTGAPCEYPMVNVLPSGTISDEMMRTQEVVIWLNLSFPFRWRLDAPGMVEATSVSTGSQPERLGWGTTVNMTCALSVVGKEWMHCTVPPTPAYLLLVEETVELTVPSAAYEGACSPIGARLLVARVFIAADTPIKLKAARALSALIGVEGFLASWFGSQAMVYDGHLMAMVGQMSCASTLDDYMTMRLMYLVAPMTDYGPFAVAYFNMFLLGVFLVVHLALTMFLSQRKGVPFNDAAEMTAFPGWSYCCAVALHAGICYGTMQIALNSSDRATASASVGGFLYVIVIFVVLFYVLRRFANVAFVEYGKVRSRPPLQRFFLPSGYWDPKQPRRMFGRMLVTVGAGRMMYVPYQMVLLTGFSVITSARPTTLSGCRTLFFVMGGGLILAASQVAWWRPHRVPLQNATTVCTMLLLAIQCCLQAPSSADASVDLDDAKAAMWLLQMVVVALRGLFDTVLVVWENFRWGKDREPLFGVLDEDHFATEDHSIELGDTYYDEDNGALPSLMMGEEGGGAAMGAHTTSAALASSVSSEIKRQRRLSIRSSSAAFTATPPSPPFSPSPPSPPKEHLPSSSGAAHGRQASRGVQRSAMLAPRHSLSLGRWEGSEGSLSSDDIL